MSDHMEPRPFNFCKYIFEDQIEEGKTETLRQMVEDHGERICLEMKRQGICDSSACKRYGWLDHY